MTRKARLGIVKPVILKIQLIDRDGNFRALTAANYAQFADVAREVSILRDILEGNNHRVPEGSDRWKLMRTIATHVAPKMLAGLPGDWADVYTHTAEIDQGDKHTYIVLKLRELSEPKQEEKAEAAA